jgi:hypothetical protein
MGEETGKPRDLIQEAKDMRADALRELAVRQYHFEMVVQDADIQPLDSSESAFTSVAGEVPQEMRQLVEDAIARVKGVREQGGVIPVSVTIVRYRGGVCGAVLSLVSTGVEVEKIPDQVVAWVEVAYPPADSRAHRSQVYRLLVCEALWELAKSVRISRPGWVDYLGIPRVGAPGDPLDYLPLDPLNIDQSRMALARLMRLYSRLLKPPSTTG